MTTDAGGRPLRCTYFHQGTLDLARANAGERAVAKVTGGEDR